MRKEMIRVLPVLIFAVCLMGSSVLFQNCAGYKTGTIPTDSSTTLTSTSCSSSDLSCEDLNNVQLTVANQDPLVVRSTAGGSNGSCDATSCVDVAGYCDVAGFTNNRISASIAGSVTLSDTILGSCDANGRFRILLPMPSGFVMGSTYAVTVVMRIYDSKGTAYENPSGLNRKQITLTSTP